MVNWISAVSGHFSCPYPHLGVTPFLDGGQQTANEPLAGAEDMLDIIPARGDGRYELAQSLSDALN